MVVQVATHVKMKVPFLIFYGTLPDTDWRVMRVMELGALGGTSPRTLLADVSEALTHEWRRWP